MDALERYRELGLDAIPLWPLSKQPVSEDWPVVLATEQWRSAPPGANIGLRQGGPGRLAVVDCDDELSPQIIGRFMSALGARCAVIQTPSGTGRHFYFRLVEAVPGTDSWTALPKGFGRGEFRFGCGSHVVAPPSVVALDDLACVADYWLREGDFAHLPVLSIRDVAPLLPARLFNEPDIPTISTMVASKRAMPRRAKRLLRGDSSGHASRSEAEHTAVVHLVNAGWGFDDILRVFRWYGPPKFREIHERRPPDAIRWLRRSYEKALAFRLHDSATRQRLQAVIDHVEATPWAGRTGAYDKAILLAHLRRAHDAGSLQYQLSVRDAAILAGMSHTAASHSTLRLISTGKLSRVRDETFDLARVYRIPEAFLDAVAPEKAWDACEGSFEAAGTKVDTSSHPQVWKCQGLSQPRKKEQDGFLVNHDIWRWRGLGKSGYEVFRTLTMSEPLTVAELAELTGRHPKTVRRALKRMAHIVDNFSGEILTLVQQNGDGRWQAVQGVDLDVIAKELGVYGSRVRQADMYERQREGRQLLFPRRRRRSTSEGADS